MNSEHPHIASSSSWAAPPSRIDSTLAAAEACWCGEPVAPHHGSFCDRHAYSEQIWGRGPVTGWGTSRAA